MEFLTIALAGGTSVVIGFIFFAASVAHNKQLMTALGDKIARELQGVGSKAKAVKASYNGPIVAPAVKLALPAPKDGKITTFGFLFKNVETEQPLMVMLVDKVKADARKRAMAEVAHVLGSSRAWVVLGESQLDMELEAPVEKEKNVSEYLHSLMYARDMFASAPEEKVIISNLISKIEKTYVHATR